MPYTYGTPEWNAAYEKTLQERLANQPRPFVVFLPEWIKEWEKLLQNDAKYKSLALPNWENPMVLHLQANPALGVDNDIFVKMDLWHDGECRSIRYIPPSEAGKPGDFVITGTLERWLMVGRKQLDVVKGMMQGKLKLKGDLPTVVRAVKAAVRIVETVGEVGGTFPDELKGEQVEQFRATVNNLLTDFSLK
jgi:putative sterol carrier protein